MKMPSGKQENSFESMTPDTPCYDMAPSPSVFKIPIQPQMKLTL